MSEIVIASGEEPPWKINAPQTVSVAPEVSHARLRLFAPNEPVRARERIFLLILPDTRPRVIDFFNTFAMSTR